ncbi:MAG: transglutaminase domain-containing protein [Gemmatimonadetes bacterium]|nr:transglutaminase domain-containing protein [Gemmatimonadota bacterium]
MRVHRRIIGGLILLTWLLTVGWQVRREYFQPEVTRLAEAARALAPGTEFYALRMGGRSVGLATSRLDTVPDGFLLDDVMTLELPALGRTGRAVVRTRVRLSPALVLQRFEFSLDSDVGRFQATGAVAGDTVLEVSVEAGGEPQKLSYRLSEPPIFAAVLPIRVAVGGELEVGETYRLPIFDPSALAMRTVEVQVDAHDTIVVPDSAAYDSVAGAWVAARFDTVPSWLITERYGGVEVSSWVDEDGRIVRASSPLGFAMERTEYEIARWELEQARLLAGSPLDNDIILSTAVQSDVDLGDVEQHDVLRFRLSGVELSGFELSGGRQELRGDTLIVRRERWGELEPGYSLPYKKMDLKDALVAEPLIQSDDPRIMGQARQIAGWRMSWQLEPKRVAQRLTGAVNAMLEKEITFSVPSAVQVLEAQKGDCNEHTVLYVALARALGLPARTAVGLVYVDGRFFYHAWPEVWLGQWVAVDPTFGQVPADAGHLRFVTGGLANQVEIVRLIGKLNIEVLE